MLRRWVAWTCLATPCALAAWVGCTVTPQNYSTLSFFFDGVPDPSAHPVFGEDGSSASGVVAASFIHKPYADNDCDACHKSKLRFTRRDASGCLSCHPGVSTEHRFTHGPVAANACLWCHTPHESAVAHLLRESDRALCTKCHSESMLDAERVTAHADPSRACLECHTGHGSDSRYMLRDGWQNAAPTAEPSEDR